MTNVLYFSVEMENTNFSINLFLNQDDDDEEEDDDEEGNDDEEGDDDE